MMLAIVAVGAMARQLELRMPWRLMRSRRAFQFIDSDNVDIDVSSTLLAQQVQRVLRMMSRSHSDPL